MESFLVEVSLLTDQDRFDAAPRVGVGKTAIPSVFAVGDTVEHKVFGKGKVTAVDGSGSDILTVDFVNGSVRKLKSSFLKKVTGDTTETATQRPKSFKTGDRVRHTRWGSGTVKGVAGDTLTIVFPGMTVSLPQDDPGLSL